MKIIIIGDKKRYEKYMPGLEIAKTSELVFFPRGTPDGEILLKSPEADVIVADAVSEVSGALIGGVRGLKMVHSEGVAFDRIDTKAASEAGVFVCNNKGANAGPVAEQAIMLMLGILRFALPGHEAVLSGRQILFKEERMISGITDLADCTVGLLGFGDIAKETAKRLAAFGSGCYYFSRFRKPPETENEYRAEYRQLHELLPLCDIVSLHMPVTDETRNMVNAEFLSSMKPGSFLINTARGELVDQNALCAALASGHIAGAGLDTLHPEPVSTDNPLVSFAKENPGKILFSPHIGGVTTGSFMCMHLCIWENIERLSQGQKPLCVVN